MPKVDPVCSPQSYIKESFNKAKERSSSLPVLYTLLPNQPDSRTPFHSEVHNNFEGLLFQTSTILSPHHTLPFLFSYSPLQSNSMTFSMFLKSLLPVLLYFYSFSYSHQLSQLSHLPLHFLTASICLHYPMFYYLSNNYFVSLVYFVFISFLLFVSLLSFLALPLLNCYLFHEYQHNKLIVNDFPFLFYLNK